MSEFAAVASQELGLIVVTAFVFAVAAWKTRQPTLIAYISAGMFLGPAFLGLVQENEFTRLSSELGLALLLFFIGMEVDLDEIRKIVKPVTAIGASSMAALAALGFGLGGLLGFNTLESVVLGSAAALSSTAVVVKMLSDRDEIKTLPGKLNVGVLLVQDIAVVAALSVIGAGSFSAGALAGSLGKMAAMLFILAPAGIYFAKNHLSKVFSHFADQRHVLVIHGLAWLFVFIELSRAAGVSIEIGAFVAGLSIAQLPYSTELRENIRPLTDLFMAVFFVNIGLKVTSVGEFLLPALGTAALFMAAKFTLLSTITSRLDFSQESSLASAANMSQVSEFSLVLAGAAASAGTVGNDFISFLSLLAVITIGASSYVITYRDLVMEKLQRIGLGSGSNEFGDEGLTDHALVIGFDRIGSEVAETLSEEMKVVVVDQDPENVDELSESDYEFLFGDFRHEEIRDSARPEEASVVVSTAARRRLNQQVLEDVSQETVSMVKADSWQTAGELYDLGAHYVMLEEVMAAEQMLEFVDEYVNDRDSFDRRAKKYYEKVSWGDRESQRL